MRCCHVPGTLLGARRTQADFAGRNMEHVGQERIRVKMRRWAVPQIKVFLELAEKPTQKGPREATKGFQASEVLGSNLVLNEENLYDQIWDDSWDILLSEKKVYKRPLLICYLLCNKEGAIKNIHVSAHRCKNKQEGWTRNCKGWVGIRWKGEGWIQ